VPKYDFTWLEKTVYWYKKIAGGGKLLRKKVSYSIEPSEVRYFLIRLCEMCRVLGLLSFDDFYKPIVQGVLQSLFYNLVT
jgi:hypothetical protein